MTGAAERRAPRVATAVALLAAGFALAAIRIGTGIGPHDEGLMLQWGARIASGEWPYRDFWCNYMPGQPLVQALIGDDLMTWRTVRAATGALTALGVYLLVLRNGGRRGWAFAGWLAAALTLAWPLNPGPNATALLLAVVALLAAPRRLVLAGAVCGLTAFFRPEIGLAALIGVWLSAAPEDRRRALLHATVASGVVLAASVAPFLTAGLVDQVFGFASIQSLQRLPLLEGPGTSDPNKVLERMFPLLLLCATVLWLIVAALRRPGRAAPLVPLVLAGAWYLQARADEFHVGPLAVALAAAAAIGAAGERRRPWIVPSALILALLVLYGADREVGRLLDARGGVPLGLEKAGSIEVPAAQQRLLTELARAVDERSERGSEMVVLPPRTDRVSAGAPLLYILLGRRNPTRYDVMQPGVVTTERVQREIATVLDHRRVPLVIRWHGAATAPEPNGSGRSSGVHLLDDAVARSYRPTARIGEYQLLERAGTAR